MNMRIPIIIVLSALHLSITGEPLITQCASALLELRSALSPCSALRSNPTIISHPEIPNLWVVPHKLPLRLWELDPDKPNSYPRSSNQYAGWWEYNALIAIGTSRLYAENHDTEAFIAAVSDTEKIDSWTETIAGELGLSSKNPLNLDTKKLTIALEGIQFKAQWMRNPSDAPAPEQTVFLITDDLDDVSDAPSYIRNSPDWAVVARIAPNCSIILHSKTRGGAPASLIPRIQKVLTR